MSAPRAISAASMARHPSRVITSWPCSANAVGRSGRSAPVTPGSYKDDAGSITNNNSTAANTDDTTPGLNIGANQSLTPTLYVDGVKVPATYDPATGTLTPTVSEPGRRTTHSATLRVSSPPSP